MLEIVPNPAQRRQLLAVQPLAGWDGNVSGQLTTTAVIETIYARENRRRTIWTPNIVLERIGIAHYPNIPVASRRKAARILRELWRAGNSFGESTL